MKYKITKIFFLIIFIIMGIYILNYSNKTVEEIIVKDKYIKNYSENSKYIVVANDNKAYEITDLLFRLKFNSTDLYNQLEIGKSYIVTTNGYRVYFISMYPNINKIEIIEEYKDE